MNKRLRKKKRLGEFREFGSEVTIKLRDGADVDAAMDDFLEHCVEENGLQFGGGSDDTTLQGFLELGRSDVAPQIQTRVRKWLDQYTAIASYSLGEIVDANDGLD